MDEIAELSFLLFTNKSNSVPSLKVASFHRHLTSTLTARPGCTCPPQIRQLQTTQSERISLRNRYTVKKKVQDAAVSVVCSLYGVHPAQMQICTQLNLQSDAMERTSAAYSIAQPFTNSSHLYAKTLLTLLFGQRFSDGLGGEWDVTVRSPPVWWDMHAKCHFEIHGFPLEVFVLQFPRETFGFLWTKPSVNRLHSCAKFDKTESF